MFKCGKGDTLLLRLGDSWIAIDCHLPVSDRPSVWDRYVAFLDELGVRRLDVFVFTHFDIDHYRGAARLIEWFHEEPRLGVRRIVTTGADSLRAITSAMQGLFDAPELQGEFELLFNTIQRCCDERHVARPTLVADHPPLRIGKFEGGWALVTIHPTQTAIEQARIQAVREGLRENPGCVDQNELSGAHFVCHENLDFPLILLGGDVAGEAWVRAFQFWREIAPQWESHQGFVKKIGPVWIKIPHHGSYSNGHHETILQDPAPSHPRHAFVTSTGRSTKHPDPRTITAYHRAGFQVWDTGLIGAQTAAQSSSRQFALLPFSHTADEHEHVITVAWPENEPRPATAKHPDAEHSH